MAEKDFFREFIEQLAQLDDLKDKDYDVKDVDNALAKWIHEHYPNGFEFDYNRRDLIIRMIKKAAKMAGLIMTSKLRPYLDAIIDMRWQQFCKNELTKSKKPRNKMDHYALLMKFARDIFVLGYSLRSLEREMEKGQSDNKKT